MASEIFSCPTCSLHNTSVLKDASLLICKGCGAIVIANVKLPQSIQTAVPADWSFIQLSTQGLYEQQAFTVVGRIRLQLRSDYRNFWFCGLGAGKYFLLMESFASFALLTPSWQNFTQDVRHLRAGESITLKGDLKVRGEYVEKCEGLSFEGEIGDWKLFSTGFFFIQASSNDSKTVVFTVDGTEQIVYLKGEKIDDASLNLKNVIQWDEWK
jgi:hypothetical protein